MPHADSTLGWSNRRESAATSVPNRPAPEAEGRLGVPGQAPTEGWREPEDGTERSFFNPGSGS